MSRRTVHREVQNENEEPKSAPRQQKENTTLPTSMLEFHSTVVYSNSVDPFRSLLAPQAWALYHKSNTTSIVPVPALMRDWPALNSAVLALFAIVPGARFSAGERSVHVPALKGSLDCIYTLYIRFHLSTDPSKRLPYSSLSVPPGMLRTGHPSTQHDGTVCELRLCSAKPFGVLGYLAGYFPRGARLIRLDLSATTVTSCRIFHKPSQAW